MTTTKLPITASPGIYLVERIEDDSQINVGKSKDKKILMGKVVSVGENREHDDGGKMVSVYKVGDIIWFFSYVDGADEFEYERKKYHCVIFHDARAKLEK